MQTNLEEQLDNFLDEQITCTQQGYVIDNKDKADWALRKISYYQNKIEEAKELKEKRIQQFNDWFKKETQENDRQIEYFESLLAPYADKELQGSKKRSFTLPNGTLGFRKSSDKFTIDDEVVSGDNEKLIKLLEKNNPELIITKKTANWGDFKKTLKICEGKVISSDGEILEIMKADRGTDVFYTKAVKE